MSPIEEVLKAFWVRFSRLPKGFGYPFLIHFSGPLATQKPIDVWRSQHFLSNTVWGCCSLLDLSAIGNKSILECTNTTKDGWKCQAYIFRGRERMIWDYLRMSSVPLSLHHPDLPMRLLPPSLGIPPPSLLPPFKTNRTLFSLLPTPMHGSYVWRTGSEAD